MSEGRHGNRKISQFLSSTLLLLIMYAMEGAK